MNAVELFQSQQRSDIREEEEREAREQVKREQDLAYEASLAADRAKDESKRQIEQQKRMEELAKRENEEREQASTFLCYHTLHYCTPRSFKNYILISIHRGREMT